MSTNVYWRPHVENKGTNLGQCVDLKKRLALRFRGREIFDEKDLPYFTALLDCDVDGALEIVEAINSHDAIEIEVSE